MLVFCSMFVVVKILCLICWEGFIVLEVEILWFLNDYIVCEFVVFVRCMGKLDVVYCKKYQMQLLNFFCELCIIFVCRDCIVIDYKEKNGYIVMNVEEVFYKYVLVLDEILIEMESEEKMFYDKWMVLEKVLDNLEQI